MIVGGLTVSTSGTTLDNVTLDLDLTVPNAVQLNVANTLNVASTRLILGQAYAGTIIQAFGSFVVADIPGLVEPQPFFMAPSTTRAGAQGETVQPEPRSTSTAS